MAEKKKILYIVEAMGGGVFTYIVDLANVLVVCFAPGADYEYTFSKWGHVAYIPRVSSVETSYVTGKAVA